MAVQSASGVVAAPVAVPSPAVRKSAHPLAAAANRTWRNPLGRFGLSILVLLVFMAVFAPAIAPYDPIAQHQGKELQSPNSEFWLGTDELGRDLLSRVIFGARPSLIVALMVVLIGGVLGIVAGLAAGYFGKGVDT